MPKPESASAGEDRSPAILIVEDDALIRLTLADHLQDHGFKVLEASSGDEALAILVAPAFTVDLVFTDVMMPGVTDGFALATWITENQPQVPVIVTSGDSKMIDKGETNRSPFQFLPKPYDMDVLVTLVRKTMDNPKR